MQRSSVFILSVENQKAFVEFKPQLTSLKEPRAISLCSTLAYIYTPPQLSCVRENKTPSEYSCSVDCRHCAQDTGSAPKKESPCRREEFRDGKEKVTPVDDFPCMVGVSPEFPSVFYTRLNE